MTTNQGFDTAPAHLSIGEQLNKQIFNSETFPSPDNLKLDSPNPKSIVVQSEDSSKSSAKRNPNIIWVRWMVVRCFLLNLML